MSNNGTLVKLKKPILYFDNVDIESVYGGESLENEISKNISEIKGELLSFAMATPKDISPKDEEPVSYIKEMVNETLDKLYEAYYDYFAAQLVNGILDEWKYSYSTDPKEIYDNCKNDDEVNEYAFPKDEHIEIKRDLNNFTFSPNDDEIMDSITRGVRNIKLNSNLSNFITDKYIILEHNRVFSDYDGQFLFKTYEAAEEVLKKKIDFHSIDYISKEFINKHPKFFDSIIELMNKNGYDDKCITKFKDKIKEFIDKDAKNNMDLLEIIYNTMNDVFYKELYRLCNIKIVKLSDLVQEYNK